METTRTYPRTPVAPVSNRCLTGSGMGSRHRAVRPTTDTKAWDHRRRGVAYVFFLGIAMFVTIIGLSALTAVRIQRRDANNANDLSAARLYAQSAIELGFAAIHLDPAWRDNLGSGTWFTDQSVSTGTMSLEVSITDDGDEYPANDPVLLIGTSVHGQARQKIEVTLVTLSDNGGLVIAAESWRRVVD